MATGLPVFVQSCFCFPHCGGRFLDPALVLERVQFDQDFSRHHRCPVRELVRHPQNGPPDDGADIG